MTAPSLRCPGRLVVCYTLASATTAKSRSAPAPARDFGLDLARCFRASSCLRALSAAMLRSSQLLSASSARASFAFTSATSTLSRPPTRGLSQWAAPVACSRPLLAAPAARRRARDSSPLLASAAGRWTLAHGRRHRSSVAAKDEPPDRARDGAAVVDRARDGDGAGDGGRTVDRERDGDGAGDGRRTAAVATPPADEDDATGPKPASKLSLPELRRLFQLAKPEARPLSIAVGLLLVSSAVSMSVPFSLCVRRAERFGSFAQRQGDRHILQRELDAARVGSYGGGAPGGRLCRRRGGEYGPLDPDAHLWPAHCRQRTGGGVPQRFAPGCRVVRSPGPESVGQPRDGRSP